ncbi:MAG: cell wall-binding repeat-containing protein [Parcubacteria group bacterium]
MSRKGARRNQRSISHTYVYAAVGVVCVVLALVLTVVGLTCGRPPVVVGENTGTETFFINEDYNTEESKDAGATTANWDTSAGQLVLPNSTSSYYKPNKATLGYDNISSNAGSSTVPAIALDASDRPIVAWQDATPGNDDILLSRWNGTNWVNMSGAIGSDNISSDPLGSGQPSLTLDSSGRPAVAWFNHTAGSPDIMISHWDGANWVDMLGVIGNSNVSANVGSSWAPSLTLDPSDRPTVAWYDDTPGNFEILVSSWDGANWVNMLGGLGATNVSNNTGTSNTPSLALDSSNRPVIAWDDITTGNNETLVTRWNGANWVKMGGALGADNVSKNAGASDAPSLMLDASGRPVVTWQDATPGNDEILLSRWNDKNWVKMGGALGADNVSANGGNSFAPSLVLDISDRPVVAWHDDTPTNNDIMVSRWLVPFVTPATAQSLTIDTSSDPIITATLLADQTLNGGSVFYSLSNNGGTTWEAVTPAASHTFVSSGSDLRWKAVLTRVVPEVDQGPVLNSLSIEYTTLASTPPAVFSYERISGDDRIDTGVAVNKRRFAAGDSAQGALLCNSANPVDCLAASSLAVQMQAGLLLNPQTGLDGRVADEIERSTTPDDSIIVLGQTSAQSDKVITDLKTRGYQNVSRQGGATRIETAVNISAKLRSLSTVPIQRVFFASGFKGTVDALVSSSPAGIPGANGSLTAILLIKDTSVPSAVQGELANYPNLIEGDAFGGTAVITDATLNTLKSSLPVSATLRRISGSDRYGTSVAAATSLFSTPTAITLAAGSAPNGGLAVDALVGGPLAASEHSPILLVQNKSLPTTVESYLISVKTSVFKLLVLGGTSAVADSVVQAALTALGH